MAQLRRFAEEFGRLGARVLLISFGADYWARAWQQDTRSPYPLLLDPARAVYRLYGLGASRLGAWSPRVLFYYLKRILRGQRLLPAQGDPHQLGGDFIVDAHGVIRLAHRSQDPLDRLPAEKILAELRRLTSEEGG